MAPGGIEKVLAWSVANSANDDAPESDEQRRQPQLDPALLAQLFGGKDDAQLMVEAMQCITNSTDTLENREIAFDNLEQLIENLDNANNLENLKLWPPLIAQLAASEPSIRYMAAWCCGTAVQNNRKSQEMFRVHAGGGVGGLVRMALEDEAKDVRGKAVYAISSYVRNFQEGMDDVYALLPEEVKGQQAAGAKIDAEDMDAVDQLRDRLKGEGAKKDSVVKGEMASAV